MSLTKENPAPVLADTLAHLECTIEAVHASLYVVPDCGHVVNVEQHLYDFGVHLGMAFQLQDDFLDAFGNPKTFGKKVGGDIVENKKTILYHLSLQQATPEQRSALLEWMGNQQVETSKKIEKVKALYVATTADSKTRDQVAHYTQMAMDSLDQTQLTPEAKNHLKAFAKDLMHRTQ